jgi:hypothetical protein
MSMETCSFTIHTPCSSELRGNGQKRERTKRQHVRGEWVAARGRGYNTGRNVQSYRSF